MALIIHSSASPAIWAGLECTINRIGDHYNDQCEKNGHAWRLKDLELFAELGVERIRYPCLWEKAHSGSLQTYNWKWADERLREIQRLGIVPIIGLLHHGSGPPHTSLIDPDFPLKLAHYARAFAERFPWVEDYTPVNEPLTTARFSCLYGYWYPHLATNEAWALALYNQVYATALAMEAIRSVNPRARLIQTDDLGRAQSTSVMKNLCDYENERRWLTFDLLFGKVGKGHPLFYKLLDFGLTERQLAWLQQHPCPPDIIGINHYPLSNRFLDHRINLYPPWYVNQEKHYADVGAIDVEGVHSPPPLSIMSEAWLRYRSPIAITEAHIAGHREAQLKWLTDIWLSAQQLNEKGAKIVAVTAWSLLGSYDWNSLCRNSDDFYEPGIFDVRASKPRPTALHHAIRKFAGKANHTQMFFKQPILITGATGTLGQAFARICAERGLPFRVLSRAEMDIAEPSQVNYALSTIRPWAVINTAGYVKVDQAEEDVERCYRENSYGPAVLARVCAEHGVPLVTFSTDLVFNGDNQNPYKESDPVSPLNVYGRSKAEGETRVLADHRKALVVRTSSFFGPWDEHNFITKCLTKLLRHETFEAVSDNLISPTYVPDLVHTVLDLLIDGESGLIHLVNDGEVSWADLARTAVDIASTAATPFKLDRSLIINRKHTDVGYRAARPQRSTLKSQRVQILPAFDNALSRYFNHLDRQLLRHDPMQTLKEPRMGFQKGAQP